MTYSTSGVAVRCFQTESVNGNGRIRATPVIGPPPSNFGPPTRRFKKSRGQAGAVMVVVAIHGRLFSPCAVLFRPILHIPRKNASVKWRFPCAGLPMASLDMPFGPVEDDPPSEAGVGRVPGRGEMEREVGGLVSRQGRGWGPADEPDPERIRKGLPKRPQSVEANFCI